MLGLGYRGLSRSLYILVAAWHIRHMVSDGRPPNLLACTGLPLQLLCASYRGQPSMGEPFLNIRRDIGPLSNPAVERDSQKAALFGSLRASRSGCPSLLRYLS